MSKGTAAIVKISCENSEETFQWEDNKSKLAVVCSSPLLAKPKLQIGCQMEISSLTKSQGQGYQPST